MTHKIITVETLKTWIDNDEAIMIDVRESGEYASSHIQNSVSIPLSKVTPESLPPHLGKKIVINCQRGMRGTAACQKLETCLNETELYNLQGGLSAWIEAGFPVVSKTTNTLPIIQQVQIFAGSWILISIILVLFIGSSFLFMTAIAGVGLIFAGLTGTCGLANWLAQAPWNRP